MVARPDRGEGHGRGEVVGSVGRPRARPFSPARRCRRRRPPRAGRCPAGGAGRTARPGR
ncbi:hypothetical protein [Ornithinimicrobium kibberense]|uniref:hypothetical protein n=1 Tax=Ornithinimicrobium kibberense TaxID=282060 RepID=UPI00361E817B